jgi:hypothetical protein
MNYFEARLPVIDAWQTWLSLNAIEDLDYKISCDHGQVTLEFFDWERAEEFAQEFGL